MRIKNVNEENEDQRWFKLLEDQTIEWKRTIILPLNSERISQGGSFS